MYTVYRYHIQNPIEGCSAHGVTGVNGPPARSLQTYVMNATWHRFVVEYANEFAKLEIPLETCDRIILSAKQARKLGKAMFTHERAENPVFSSDLNWDGTTSEKTPSDRLSTNLRFDITRELGFKLNVGEIGVIWTWMFLFLYGGEIEIHQDVFPYDPGTGRP